MMFLGTDSLGVMVSIPSFIWDVWVQFFIQSFDSVL